MSGEKGGLHVWDIAQGNEAAFVATALGTRPRFHPGGRFIVTGGREKVVRWPFDAPADSGELRIGPAEMMVSAPGDKFGEVHFTPDGEWLAVGGRSGSLVMKWSDPTQRVAFGEKASLIGHDYLVLSPDGRWVVSEDHHGVTVWNAHDGSLLRQLIAFEGAGLALSPDGHTLATATSRELVLWDTTTWQPRRRTATGADRRNRRSSRLQPQRRAARRRRHAAGNPTARRAHLRSTRDTNAAAPLESRRDALQRRQPPPRRPNARPARTSVGFSRAAARTACDGLGLVM